MTALLPAYLLGAVALAVYLRAHSQRWHVEHAIIGLLWPLGVLVACVDAIAWWWEDT